jgi:hypothetical protein
MPRAWNAIREQELSKGTKPSVTGDAVIDRQGRLFQESVRAPIVRRVLRGRRA